MNKIENITLNTFNSLDELFSMFHGLWSMPEYTKSSVMASLEDTGLDDESANEAARQYEEGIDKDSFVTEMLALPVAECSFLVADPDSHRIVLVRADTAAKSITALCTCDEDTKFANSLIPKLLESL